MLPSKFTLILLNLNLSLLDLNGLSRTDCNISFSKKYQTKEFFKAKDNESEQTKLSDNEEKETREFAEKSCYICKQKGHIAKKCSKK